MWLAILSIFFLLGTFYLYNSIKTPYIEFECGNYILWVQKIQRFFAFLLSKENILFRNYWFFLILPLLVIWKSIYISTQWTCDLQSQITNDSTSEQRESIDYQELSCEAYSISWKWVQEFIDSNGNLITNLFLIFCFVLLLLYLFSRIDFNISNSGNNYKCKVSSQIIFYCGSVFLVFILSYIIFIFFPNILNY